jgi:hypothetical protein
VIPRRPRSKPPPRSVGSRRPCVPTEHLDGVQKFPCRFECVLAGPQLDPLGLVGSNLDGCDAAVARLRVRRSGSFTPRDLIRKPLKLINFAGREPPIGPDLAVISEKRAAHGGST